MRLAVVTAVYPAALGFLKPFADSLAVQSDLDFALWIGLDGVEEEAVHQAAGRRLAAGFASAPVGVSPAEVRNLVLARALPGCDAVALVDADDILGPSRVAAAKAAAAQRDLTAAAMDFVDAAGRPIPGRFDPARGEAVPVRTNVYGFSNTTWRASVLAACLPAPADCVLMDWFVATTACLMGATTGIDPAPRMLYRQHPGNIARVLPPFSGRQVRLAVDLVLAHYDLLLRGPLSGFPGPAGAYGQAREQAQRFALAMADPARCERYVQALNALPAGHVWWSCVAHPKLEEIWKP